jgi:hypothetical protein
MPLVFVHGVATRQTPKYQAWIVQRDALFKRLAMGADTAVFDPDWGSGAVRFAKGGWVPTKGAAEPYSIGSAPLAVQGPSAAAIAAPHDLEQAVDLALASLFVQRAASGAAPSDEELRVFEAAVRYLEGAADPSAFAPTETDAQFARSLESELKPLLPAAPGEAMTVSNVFSRIGEAIKMVTDPLRNAGSDAVLKLIRKPLSDQVALFLGDIFVYLRWRETDGAAGTYNRIFEPIIDDLGAANAARTAGQKLVIVGHSLGAVILYDLLTDPRAMTEIETASGKPLVVDALVTVGAQPGLFADMGLYDGQVAADGRLAKPDRVQRWMNVYDYTDVLSFRTEPFFSGVKDYEFDNVAGALEAHSAYFQRPGFYKRLRARLAEP